MKVKQTHSGPEPWIRLACIQLSRNILEMSDDGAEKNFKYLVLFKHDDFYPVLYRGICGSVKCPDPSVRNTF